MNAPKPFVGRLADLTVVVSKHRLPSSGKIDLVTSQIPIPETIVCPSGGKGEPLLTLSKRLLQQAALKETSHFCYQPYRIIRSLKIIVRARLQTADHAPIVLSPGADQQNWYRVELRICSQPAAQINTIRALFRHIADIH